MCFSAKYLTQSLETALMEGDPSPYQSPLFLALAVIQFVEDETSQVCCHKQGFWLVAMATLEPVLFSGIKLASAVVRRPCPA